MVGFLPQKLGNHQPTYATRQRASPYKGKKITTTNGYWLLICSFVHCASASLTKRIDEPVKLADEAEGPSPLWNGSTCKRQCYGEDQVTVYPRMPQDRAGCVARYTQAEEVREGGIPEATEKLLSERASQEQTRRSPSRGCKKATCRCCLRPASFTRARS